MPNDAKLGLVAGVGLVILVAVVFFRKDLATARSMADQAAPNSVSPSGSVTPPTGPRGLQRPSRAYASNRTEDTPAEPAPGRKHTVQEGETLFSLARSYYGDGDRFVDIYRLNRNVLMAPDRLVPGTVLVLPDLPERR